MLRKNKNSLDIASLQQEFAQLNKNLASLEARKQEVDLRYMLGDLTINQRGREYEHITEGKKYALGRIAVITSLLAGNTH